MTKIESIDRASQLKWTDMPFGRYQIQNNLANKCRSFNNQKKCQYSLITLNLPLFCSTINLFSIVIIYMHMRVPGRLFAYAVDPVNFISVHNGTITSFLSVRRERVYVLHATKLKELNIFWNFAKEIISSFLTGNYHWPNFCLLEYDLW